MVFLEQTRSAQSGMLAQRIAHVLADVLELALDGKHLPQQRVRRIARLHARSVATGNAKSKAGSGGVSRGKQICIEPEGGEECLGARNDVRHFRLPARGLGGIAGNRRGTSRITGLPVVLAGVG